MASEVKQDKEHVFKKPERKVKGEKELEIWTKSQAYAELMGCIQIINDAVVDKTVSDMDDSSQPPIIQQLVDLVETLKAWMSEVPPIEQPQRYGNKAFRTWWERVRDNADVLIKGLLPDHLAGAVVELKVYFLQSFGNATRIDYGTGHEFKFCAFLCCLMKIGLIPQDAAAAVALKVFSRYMDLCRDLQTVYRMEPAGSHGVWGLDDFQFLPFIWGSSQLKGHPKLLPKDFVEPGIAEQYAQDYMFMACIKFINSVKTGPFAEHSNTLWGISGVAEWSKVNSGLIKMFKAEVLGKFPVIQHFPFGTILSIEPV